MTYMGILATVYVLANLAYLAFAYGRDKQFLERHKDEAVRAYERECLVTSARAWEKAHESVNEKYVKAARELDLERQRRVALEGKQAAAKRRRR